MPIALWHKGRYAKDTVSLITPLLSPWLRHFAS